MNNCGDSFHAPMMNALSCGTCEAITASCAELVVAWLKEKLEIQKSCREGVVGRIDHGLLAEKRIHQDTLDKQERGRLKSRKDKFLSNLG